jgi:hypothetical protein
MPQIYPLHFEIFCPQTAHRMAIVSVCSGDPARELARQVASMGVCRSGSSQNLPLLRLSLPREDGGLQIEIRRRNGILGERPEAE